jgi:hypothetical protein
MPIEKLEALLRSRGWEPYSESRSLSRRAWKHVADARTFPTTIYVPRMDQIPANVARSILRRVSRIDLR